MTNCKQENRRKEIETAFAEHPWLAQHLRKEMLEELQVIGDPDYSFFLKRMDCYLHMEVMWLLDQNGEYLGEVNDFEKTSGSDTFSFGTRNETMKEALERIPFETFYLLKNRNYTHAVLYKAPDKKSLLQYSREVLRY